MAGVEAAGGGRHALSLSPAATGAAFVREISTGTYASDMGPWTPDAGKAMRYRNRLGAKDVAMLYNVSGSAWLESFENIPGGD